VKRNSGAPWLLVLAVLASVAVAMWFARGRIQPWTHQRLTQQRLHELAGLPEPNAAQLVRRLSQDDQWLAVFVAAAADARPAVAGAGRAALLDRLEHWAQLPAGESSPQVAALAQLLAEQAPRLSPEHRAFSQSLAHRLLLWPVDSRKVDAAGLIADCETVLNLPGEEPQPIQLAAAPPAPRHTPPSLPPPPAQPEIPPPSALPPVITTQPPAPLIDASGPLPTEPRRFTVPPRGARISDE
jgi:hypothetical protein